ncbi:MAG: LysM peptidoglycan-binding domain-containing protein, partial [Desulfobacteraceae bacterium]|nr:LysM peptidoglycan-binding domain-containing protein [Desulfobacteraceae bacterium]
VATIKSLSSPGADGFNELRIQDRKGFEQFFFHAQRDMDLRVKNDRRTFIGNNDHRVVEKTLYEQINNESHLNIKSDRKIQVGGGESLSTGKDWQHKAGTNYAVKAGESMNLESGSDLVVESGASVTLKAGSSFIVLDSSGIAISGPDVKINSGGSSSSGSGLNVIPPAAPEQATDDLPGKLETIPSALLTKNSAEAAPAGASGAMAFSPGQYPLRGFADLGKTAIEEQASWIEVRLTDQDAKPVSGKTFSVRTGETNYELADTGADGIGRINKIPPGNWEISWLNEDKSNWDPIEDAETIDYSDETTGKVHTVKKGECLYQIAHRHGKRIKDIWDHPKNSDLKEKRKNPNILFADDKLFIPEKGVKAALCTTEKRHEFVYKDLPLIPIRFRLLQYGRSRANETYELDTGKNGIIKGKTDGQGYVKAKVPADVKKALLRVKSEIGEECYEIQTGLLDPTEQVPGVQQRLYNLGFDINVTENPDDQTKNTLINFQSAHGLEASGESDNPTTSQLGEAHGR